jgi:hypothetical protein
VGKEYGLIPLARAGALYYSFYEEYKEKWLVYQQILADFNDEVEQFNREAEGKTFYEGSLELARLEAWKAELKKQEELIDKLSEELGNIWFESKGIVREVQLHWGPE